jgi:hypothetical protein
LLSDGQGSADIARNGAIANGFPVVEFILCIQRAARLLPFLSGLCDSGNALLEYAPLNRLTSK